MNLDNFKRRSRLFAAGMCGAAVLAFTGLDQQAQAQDQPDEPKAQERAQQENDKEMAELESQKSETNHEIDLSDASFEAEVVRAVGNSALIVQADEKEFLLPRSVVSLASEENRELSQKDLSKTDDVKDNKVVGAENEVEVENDVATAEGAQEVTSDDTQIVATDDTQVTTSETTQVVTAEPDKSDSLKDRSFKAGDKVRVSFANTDAELVALENKVLTVRTQDSVMQLPAEALSDEAMSKVSFTANIDGKTQIMTLKEALDDSRKLSISQDWPTQLPKDADVGVIVANNPGRLLVATVSNDKIELIQIPQSMQAGEAVSLKLAEGEDIAVSPLDGATGMVAYEKTEFQGTLLSQNSDFIILESGEHHLMLPAGLELKDSEQNQERTNDMRGERQVTVILPAGQAEMLAQHEDNVVLETKHGMAHLPLALLNQNEDSMQSLDISSKTESETVQSY